MSSSRFELYDFFQHYDADQHLLNLSNQDIEDQDLPAICKFLKDHNEIEKIDLSHNNLVGEELKVLDNKPSVKLLAKIRSLTQINLSHNSLIDEAVSALATSKFIKVLNVSNNKLGESVERIRLLRDLIIIDMEFSAYYFKHNKILQELHLCNNALPKFYLAELLENKHLQTLYIQGNEVNIGLQSLLASHATIQRHDVVLENPRRQYSLFKPPSEDKSVEPRQVKSKRCVIV